MSRSAEYLMFSANPEVLRKHCGGNPHTGKACASCKSTVSLIGDSVFLIHGLIAPLVLADMLGLNHLHKIDRPNCAYKFASVIANLPAIVSNHQINVLLWSDPTQFTTEAERMAYFTDGQPHRFVDLAAKSAVTATITYSLDVVTPRCTCTSLLHGCACGAFAREQQTHGKVLQSTGLWQKGK